MAKAKKVAKKATKTFDGLGLTKSLRDHGVLTSKPSKTMADLHVKSSKVRQHIEGLAKKRRDAAIVWPQIKDTNMGDDEIKKLVKSRHFDTLLGEIS